tara:strand:+ start:435 stop:1673 length:1239 start_codon:yes stop_codon:yes gene_type:complete
MKHALFISCILIVGLGGCGKKDTDPPSEKSKSLPKVELPEISPPGVTRGPKITLAEARTIGKKLQAAVESNDAEMVLRLIDLDNLIRHGLPNHLNGTQQEKQIVASFRSKFDEAFVRNLNAGDYQFLRASETPDGAQSIMRLIPPDDSLNYHRLVLGRNMHNEPCVVDIFVYTSGEPLSHTIGRLIAQSMPDTLSPDAKARQAVKKMREMMVALQRGNPADALAIYDSMDPKWQQQKTIMQTRIMAANKVAASNLQKGQPMGNDYRKAVQDFQQAFPNAENLAMLLIDFHYFNEDFKQARAAVDQLDEQIGGDSYLNLHRGNLALSQGKKQAAKGFYTQLIKDIPKNADSYTSLIDLALADKDFKEVTRLLISAEENTDIRFDPDFNGANDYKEYIASPENEKWKTYKRGEK